MANRFNQWAPTRYVNLPIDYYQSALMYKEQKTNEALENINAILSSYGSIKPISKDPQALYDQTIGKLRSSVESIAEKRDLTTPTAQREVRKLINDPEIVDALDKVYTDALYATQAKKELNEYLKKNPEVNAVDYLSAFANLGNETGDATKFNPDRFKNMPALSEYFDINKRIEEGIARLHPDSKEVKDILGPYYTEYKRKGLLPQKIREYVSSQVAKDPLVRGQMNRNLRYKGYLTNPYDPQAGLGELGEGYRSSLLTQQSTLQNGLAELYGGRSEKDIDALRKKDKGFAAKEQQFLSGLESLKAYTDKTTGDFVDPNTLSAMMERDSLVYGFDSMAYMETLDSKRYSPLYIAQQTAALNYHYRKRLQDEKLKAEKDMLTDAMSFTYDQRNQVPVTPDRWNDYVNEKIPDLKGLVLGRNGEFTPDNYKKDLIEVRKGEYYLPGDVEVTAESGKGFTSGGGGASPVLKYRLKPGAKPVSNTAEGATKLFNEGKSKIQNYLNKHSIGGQYDLNNGEDLKRAIQDIVAFNQQTESIYTPIVTDPTSNSPTRINRVRESLNFTKTYKLSSNGSLQEVGNDTKIKIREHLGTKGAQVRFQPVSMSGKAYDVVSVGNENYYIESTPLQQSVSAGANSVVGQMLAPGDPVRELPDGSLFMKFMGPNGQLQTGVISGGATEKAQGVLKATWDSNVKRIMDTGNVSQTEAEQMMLSTLRSNGSASAVFLNNGKSVNIDVPVSKFKGANGKTYYYAWGGSQEFPFRGVGDVIKSSIRSTQSQFNPERMYDMFPYLRAANKENALGLDDDIISNVFQDLEQD